MPRYLLLGGFAFLATGCRNVIPARTPLAPPFTAASSLGHDISLLDLTKDKNLVIVFTAPGGDVGQGAMKVAETIAKLEGWTALTAADLEPSELKSQGGVTMISDIGDRIAMRYKARISPTFQVIGKGGTWGPKIEGADAISMSELEKAVGLDAKSLAPFANVKAKDQANIW